MTEEERIRLAEDLGLRKFAGLYPEAFERAFQYALSMLAQVPEPEALSDEPAHVFRAASEVE